MMKKIFTIIILFFFIPCAFGEISSSDSNSKDKYIIGSGDILEIVTWKEPDFSRDDILVRPDGNITLPLLNDIQATGLTPMALKKILEKKLELYVDSPVVTVIIKIPESKKFYIKDH